VLVVHVAPVVLSLLVMLVVLVVLQVLLVLVVRVLLVVLVVPVLYMSERVIFLIICAALHKLCTGTLHGHFVLALCADFARLCVSCARLCAALRA
jgi:hypothetical protein